MPGRSYMGFRFQKRIRIFKGLTLNLSKSGTSSWTAGAEAGRSMCAVKGLIAKMQRTEPRWRAQA